MVNKEEFDGVQEKFSRKVFATLRVARIRLNQKAGKNKM